MERRSDGMKTSFIEISPHEEAAAIIAGKPALAKEVFDELLPELRARAFTVSGVEDADVLQRVRDAIAGLATGDRWEDVKDDVVAELDPWLGDGSEKRAELLLRTQSFQAFQTSGWRSAQADPVTTHLQYLTMEDDRVRDSHAALDGLVLPKDDPFWEEHYPPWDWNCRCLTRTMDDDQVSDEKEKDEDKNPEDRNVIEGPALQKLRDGQLLRNGQAFDVSAPTGDGAFKFHPDNFTLPLDQLKSRYDPDVWAQFAANAKKATLPGGETLWDWLNKTAPASALWA